MCVILSIYKKDDTAIEAISEKIENLKISNPHGMGIVSFNNETENWDRERNLIIDKEKTKRILKNSNLINIHLRQTTAGLTNKANIHFWQYQNWLFAHNGHIADLGNDKIHSDSFLLFQKIIKKRYLTNNNKIKHLKIKELINTLSFWGRFVIINKETQKTYYFGDFHALSIDKKTLIISTEKITLNEYHDLFGILFEENTHNYLNASLDGIFSIDRKTEKFVQLEKDLKESIYEGFTHKDFNNETKDFNNAYFKKNEYNGCYNFNKKKKKKKKYYNDIWHTI